MLLLEINEFNPELLKLAARELNLGHIKRLTELRHSKTITDDTEERFGLDPWVQWVSIHTGKTSAQHGIRHLGDVPNLDDKQIWEVLGEQGVHCGVWGAMNASRGSGQCCDFFFPDPWTFSEKAYPEELNGLLSFPRYYSKNYGDLNAVQTIKTLSRLAVFCLRPSVFFTLFPLLPVFVSHLLKNGFKDYLLFVLFDLVNAKLFSLYHKKSRPDFSVLFLNSIAHLQHHKWTEKEGLSKEMKIAFILFDQVLATIFSTVDSDSVLVANAFSQYCSYDQQEFLYRQKNPEKFLAACGIHFAKVEQAMTNDGHVFFSDQAQAQLAASVLEQATVNGKAVFHVDYDQQTPEKLFYQVIIWDKQDEQAVIEINNRQLGFLEQFEEVTRRSGSHTNEGDVFSNALTLPDTIYNHEIYNYVLQQYNSGRA